MIKKIKLVLLSSAILFSFSQTALADILSSTTDLVGSNENQAAFNAIAGGFKAHADGFASTAIGVNAKSLGTHSVSYGRGVIAEGTYSTAIGANAIAHSDESLAIGKSAITGELVDSEDLELNTGVRSTAVGYSTQAIKDNSSAFGSGAKALHIGSTAIGFGATTTSDNQVVLGTTGDTITALGVHENTGDLTTNRLVTVNELGNLESVETSAITVMGGDDTTPISGNQLRIQDNSITTSDLSDGAITQAKLANNSVGSNQIINESIQTSHLANSSVTNDKIADGAISYNKFDQDVKDRFDSLDQGITTANGGVAVAMAMANIPALSANKQFGFGIAMSSFEGEMGFAASSAMKLGDKGPVLQASLGQSGGTYSGAVGLGWSW